MEITAIIGLAIGALVGAVAAFLGIRKSTDGKIQEANKKADLTLQQADITAKSKLESAKSKAESIIAKADAKNEAIKQEKISQAKQKYAKLKTDYSSFKAEQKVEMKEREMQVVALEKELNAKQKGFKDQLESIEHRESEVKVIKGNLEKQLQIVNKKKEELDQANEKRIKALEGIAKLSEEEAKEQLLDAVKGKAESEALSLEKNIIAEAKESAAKEARKIIIQTIQRMGAEYTIENTVSVFNLDSDDLKGQIIGREGRNIRALEAATGAEIVVDDTPEAIIISSFDPIRREICRLSLKRLVADGRIHPAKIEETVTKVQSQLEDQIKEIGERTVIDLDIHGFNSYLIKMVGRMRFRSSYGQNLLKHSIETANLCAVMAAELGMSSKQIKMAKRAGLLHDIGKVPDAEADVETPHAILGMKWAEKHGEKPEVCNAIGAHHDEIEMTTLLSPIIQVCDAISGARPGARRQVLDSYIQRLKDLEAVAFGFPGVKKAYAIQAGRELRVIVESEKVTDDKAASLSFEISQKIQTDMTYPGQVKVTVIRETRAVNVAK